MTQTHKKPVGNPAAKLASNVANKAAKSTYAAVEHTRSSAENVVKIGSKAVKEFMSTSAGEAQKAQDKVFAMSREGAQHLAKGADAVTKVLYESIALSRDNVETAIECGNMTANLAKDASSEILEYANKAFSDTVEISKEAFACRTINDIFELQNRVMKTSIDSFFNQTVKLSGMVFEYTQEALEPVNERVSQIGDKLSKAFSA